jgi:hypothetical protein
MPFPESLVKAIELQCQGNSQHQPTSKFVVADFGQPKFH